MTYDELLEMQAEDLVTVNKKPPMSPVNRLITDIISLPVVYALAWVLGNWMRVLAGRNRVPFTYMIFSPWYHATGAPIITFAESFMGKEPVDQGTDGGLAFQMCSTATEALNDHCDDNIFMPDLWCLHRKDANTFYCRNEITFKEHDMEEAADDIYDTCKAYIVNYFTTNGFTEEQVLGSPSILQAGVDVTNEAIYIPQMWYAAAELDIIPHDTTLDNPAKYLIDNKIMPPLYTPPGKVPWWENPYA